MTAMTVQGRTVERNRMSADMSYNFLKSDPMHKDNAVFSLCSDENQQEKWCVGE